MKTLGLSDRILRYLTAHPVYWNGGDIEKLAMRAGYKGSTASRELRRLHEEGLIEREERKGRRASSVWYKIKDQSVLPF